MGLILIEPATALPITRAEAIAQLKLDDNPPDAPYLDGLIAAAANYVQSTTRRSMMQQTWEMSFDDFPCNGAGLRLDMPPVTEIVSVKYYDGAGTDTTISASDYYAVKLNQGDRRAEVFPKVGTVWPAAQCGRREGVRVRYKAGYSASDFAAGIKQLMLVQITLWYENRLPLEKAQWTLEDLLSFFTLHTF